MRWQSTLHHNFVNKKKKSRAQESPWLSTEELQQPTLRRFGGLQWSFNIAHYYYF